MEDICYDEKLLTNRIIYLEILTFLNVFQTPSLVSFDKHTNRETKTYKIVSNMCCQYCFKIAIDKLFEIDGIEKVENNYIKQYYGKYDQRNKDTFIIYYDSKIISNEKIKEIEKELDL